MLQFFGCHAENYNMEFFLFDLVWQFSNVFQHDQLDRMGRNLSARVHVCETRSLIFRIELM